MVLGHVSRRLLSVTQHQLERGLTTMIPLTTGSAIYFDLADPEPILGWGVPSYPPPPCLFAQQRIAPTSTSGRSGLDSELTGTIGGSLRFTSMHNVTLWCRGVENALSRMLPQAHVPKGDLTRSARLPDSIVSQLSA